MDIVPLGKVRSNFNFSLEDKRILVRAAWALYGRTGEPRVAPLLLSVGTCVAYLGTYMYMVGPSAACREGSTAAMQAPWA